MEKLYNKSYSLLPMEEKIKVFSEENLKEIEKYLVELDKN